MPPPSVFGPQRCVARSCTLATSHRIRGVCVRALEASLCLVGSGIIRVHDDFCRFRSNGDSRHSPESVYLPTLDESPLDSDAQDRTLVRAPPPPVPLRNRSPSHNLRPKSTPVLPSMISSSAGVSSFSSDDGRIEFDEDESCATLRVAHSRMSYNPVLDHGRGRGEWIEEGEK